MNLAKHLAFCLAAFPAFAFAQTIDTVAPPHTERMRSHEFGINATMLLKQVFNLSNNTFQMLPYDVTYKCIGARSAWRFGLGLDVNYSTSETSITSTGGGGSTPPGPDEDAPTYSRSAALDFRGGWEKRFQLEKRVLLYAGFDLAAGYGKEASQTAIVFNNLPNSYSYSRTTITRNLYQAGGGPVGGIQLLLGKRLSLFTEVPLYAMYTYDETKTVDYDNSYQQFSGEWISSTDTHKEKLTGANVKLTLPVTLYLGIKF